MRLQLTEAWTSTQRPSLDTDTSVQASGVGQVAPDEGVLAPWRAEPVLVDHPAVLGAFGG